MAQYIDEHGFLNEIDHEFTPQIVCPHCGYEDEDVDEYHDNEGESRCGNCNRWFLYERHFSYSTYHLDETDDE
ncbi:hypothetical protein V6R21_18960 [Limibacter armeniacum]|uniref:hypothetical protein n=1 Tax=Limibacter armeniacum TaxID=466084 RepID=UPI002FE51848